MFVPMIILDGPSETVGPLVGCGLEGYGCVLLVEHGCSLSGAFDDAGIVRVADTVLGYLDRHLDNHSLTLRAAVHDGPSSMHYARASQVHPDPQTERIMLLALQHGAGAAAFEVQDRNGVWREVVAPTGAIIVRAGELLREWKRDGIPAVGFRNLTCDPPYIAYYLQPHPDTLLHPVPRTTVAQYRERRMEELAALDVPESS